MKTSQVTQTGPTRQRWSHLYTRIMLLVILAVSLGIMAIAFSPQILTVDSGEFKADAIIVLGGGSYQLRPDRAAELFKKGLAPLVVVSGRGDFELNVQALEREGVPESAIMVEPLSKSTLQNAKFSIDILHRKGVHHAIIVTSWYHSRRALQCFQQLGPDIHFYSCPSYWGYSYSELFSRGVIGYLVYEYVKVLGYWVCYGIRPF